VSGISSCQSGKFRIGRGCQEFLKLSSREFVQQLGSPLERRGPEGLCAERSRRPVKDSLQGVLHHGGVDHAAIVKETTF
jgi:hypothetical protein